MVLICSFLMSNSVKHNFMFMFVTSVSCLAKCLLRFFAHLKKCSFGFLTVGSSLCPQSISLPLPAFSALGGGLPWEETESVGGSFFYDSMRPRGL